MQDYAVQVLGKFCPSEFLITLFNLSEAAKALILN